MGAAAAPAHRSNPTTSATDSCSQVIHRSRTTRGMPIAKAWTGADRLLRLRKALWVPLASSDAACGAAAANLGAIRDTPRRPRPSHGVRSPRHRPAGTAHIAGRLLASGKRSDTVEPDWGSRLRHRLEVLRRGGRMIPSDIASQIQRGVEDLLRTTFPTTGLHPAALSATRFPGFPVWVRNHPAPAVHAVYVRSPPCWHPPRLPRSPGPAGRRGLATRPAPGHLGCLRTLLKRCRGLIFIRQYKCNMYSKTIPPPRETRRIAASGDYRRSYHLRKNPQKNQNWTCLFGVF